MKAIGLFFIFAVIVFSLAGCSDDPQIAFMTAVKENDAAALSEILEKDIDINANDEDGWTALMHAAKNGNPDIISTLIENDADPTITTADGVSAYQLAGENDNAELELLLLKITEPVGREYWISSEVGLRFRTEPVLSSETMNVLAYGAKVLVREISLINVTIDEVEGNWAKAEWRGKTGWLFDAYITDRPAIAMLLKSGAVYQAEHKDGVKQTDAGKSITEEIRFGAGRQCTYTKRQYYFDAVVTQEQNGLYEIKGDVINLLLSPGKIITKYSDGSDMPDKEETAAAINLSLNWLDDLQGFIGQTANAKIKDGDYALDKEAFQYKMENDAEFDYIGYFHGVE